MDKDASNYDKKANVDDKESCSGCTLDFVGVGGGDWPVTDNGACKFVKKCTAPCKTFLRKKADGESYFWFENGCKKCQEDHGGD